MHSGNIYDRGLLYVKAMVISEQFNHVYLDFSCNNNRPKEIAVLWVFFFSILLLLLLDRLFIDTQILKDFDSQIASAIHYNYSHSFFIHVIQKKNSLRSVKAHAHALVQNDLDIALLMAWKKKFQYSSFTAIEYVWNKLFIQWKLWLFQWIKANRKKTSQSFRFHQIKSTDGAFKPKEK